MATSIETVLQAFRYPDDEKTERELMRGVEQLECQSSAASETGASFTVRSSLGTLEVFPLEIFHMILSDLDLETLTNFRAVSRTATMVIDSLPKYTSLYTLAPTVFQAVISFGAGAWITCETLRDALSTRSCAVCGEFGSFIYLLSCKRVCPECFTQTPEYPMALAGFAKFLCDLDDLTLGRLRTLIIPERSACSECVHRPLQLVSRSEALRAGLSLHGTCSQILNLVEEESDDDDDLNDNDNNQNAFSAEALSDTESTVCSDKADLVSGVIFYAGAVRAPHVNFTTGNVEWGKCCKACSDSGRSGREKMSWSDVDGEKYANYLKDCPGAMTILSCVDYCQHVARSAAIGYVPMPNEE
ncbi:hypothetical protein PRK78_006639 [Emydomyces testavorans]|uniref:F-box domain-containing protein n=1 Tax=Emydomyces testavorans TaxID=2070801 RepID=A0AAF0DLS6_9EURO|nr:hypothetical protein PRK78_006639 [Emydomyces testavorans]